MNQLSYHQRTYELLTSHRIDPQKAIRAFDEYEGPFTFHHYEQTHNREIAERKVLEWRNAVLPWTELALYQRPIMVSPANVQALDVLEQKHHTKLPAAVREWYSLDISPDIMTVWDASGYPPIYRRIEDLRPIAAVDSSYSENPDITRPDLWVFLHAEYVNQGGEPILFQVTDEDDPPVFAHVADEFIPIAPTFSAFIFLHFWGWHARYIFENGIYIYADPLLGPPEQYWLSQAQIGQHLQQLDVGTGWRYCNDDCRMFFRSPGEGYEATAAGGLFLTRDIDSLSEVFRNLWGKFPPAFFMHSTRGDMSTDLIATLQREQLLNILVQADAWLTEGEVIATVGTEKLGILAKIKLVLDELVETGNVEVYHNGEGARSFRLRL